MTSDTSSPRPARRKHSAAFKAQILQACSEPGASLSGIAVAHGLNPNLVQRWRREARRSELALPTAPAFIPIVTPRPAATPAAPAARQGTPAATSIEVRLQRGALQAQVRWPAQAVGDCTAFLRELFR